MTGEWKFWWGVFWREWTFGVQVRWYPTYRSVSVGPLHWHWTHRATLAYTKRSGEGA